MNQERHPLLTILTPAEADRLAETLPFLRTKTESGRAYRGTFISAEDHAEAERLIAQWRSER